MSQSRRALFLRRAWTRFQWGRGGQTRLVFFSISTVLWTQIPSAVHDGSIQLTPTRVWVYCTARGKWRVEGGGSILLLLIQQFVTLCVCKLDQMRRSETVIFMAIQFFRTFSQRTNLSVTALCLVGLMTMWSGCSGCDDDDGGSTAPTNNQANNSSNNQSNNANNQSNNANNQSNNSPNNQSNNANNQSNNATRTTRPTTPPTIRPTTLPTTAQTTRPTTPPTTISARRTSICATMRVWTAPRWIRAAIDVIHVRTIPTVRPAVTRASVGLDATTAIFCAPMCVPLVPSKPPRRSVTTATGCVWRPCARTTFWPVRGIVLRVPPKV